MNKRCKISRFNKKQKRNNYVAKLYVEINIRHVGFIYNLFIYIYSPDKLDSKISKMSQSLCAVVVIGGGCLGSCLVLGFVHA